MEDRIALIKNYPDVLNVQQLSEILDVSEKTVYSLLRDGEITSTKVGRAYRIPKIHLLQYLKLSKKS